MFKSFLFAIALAVPMLAGPAGATTYVAVNGIDGPGCGTKAAPCRSIAQGVENVAAGDTVIVGPGRYGDLDGDGTIDAGDEMGFPFCGCLLGIDKPVTVVSSAGAAATVIDARSTPALRSVFLVGDGIVFGKPGKGFTVTSSTDENTVGIYVVGENVKVAGNQLMGRTDKGVGIQVGEGNVGSVVIEGNQAVGWFRGISASGPNVTIRKNVASLNTVGVGDGGVNANLVGNVVVANFSGILAVQGVASGNAALGNVRGIEVSGSAATIEKNNTFGNVACGLFATPFVEVSATNNYWGAPTGPGPDPADGVCLTSGAVVTSTPFATKPFSVKAQIKP